MKNFVFLVSSLVFLGFVSAQQQVDHKVDVTVYYESLCPDSRKFITKQLYPALQGNLSNFVNLTLIPYGKASHTFVDNAYNFTCHHGPDECTGNKIQACALKSIDSGSRSLGLGYNKVAVAFVNCLMDKTTKNDQTAIFPTKDCASATGVTNIAQIDNCAHHPEGATFLANLGKLTSSLTPPLTSVPTVVFNKQYKKSESDLAQSNFVKAVCNHIDNDKKPSECTSGASGVALSLGTLVLCFLALLKY